MKTVCAGCPALAFAFPPEDDGVGFAYCRKQSTKVDALGRVEAVAVPQQTKPIGGGRWRATFHRIPVHCPLPNHVVLKSATPMPHAHVRATIFRRPANTATLRAG